MLLSISCFNKLAHLSFKCSLSNLTAGVIDCLLGQISHSSVGLGLNPVKIGTILFANKSVDKSKLDLVAIPLPATHQRLTISASFEIRSLFHFNANYTIIILVSKFPNIIHHVT